MQHRVRELVLAGVLFFALALAGCGEGSSGEDGSGPGASTAVEPGEPAGEPSGAELRRRALRLLAQSDTSDNSLSLEWTLAPRSTSQAGDSPRAEFTLRVRGDGTGDLASGFSDIREVIDHFGSPGPEAADYNRDGTIDFSDIRKVIDRFGTGVSGFRVYQDSSPEPSTRADTLDLSGSGLTTSDAPAGAVSVSFAPPGGMTGFVRLVPLDRAGNPAPELSSPVLELTPPPDVQNWEVLDTELRDDGDVPDRFFPVGDNRLITVDAPIDSDQSTVQLWNTESRDDQVMDEMQLGDLAGGDTYNEQRKALYLAEVENDICQVFKLTVSSGELSRKDLFLSQRCGFLLVPDKGEIMVVAGAGLTAYNMKTGEKVWERSQPGLEQLGEVQLIPPAQDKFLSFRSAPLAKPYIRTYRVSDGELVEEKREVPGFNMQVFEPWNSEVIITVDRHDDEFSEQIQKVSLKSLSTLSTFPLPPSGKKFSTGFELARPHGMIFATSSLRSKSNNNVVVYDFETESVVAEFSLEAEAGGIQLAPDASAGYMSGATSEQVQGIIHVGPPESAN